MSKQDLVDFIKSFRTNHSLGGCAIKVVADISSSLSTNNIAKETGGNLATISNNSVSKIDRIKGASNYTRVLTYYAIVGSPGGANVATITHTGTTPVGAETVVETIVYANNLIDNSRVTSVTYS